MEKLPYHRIISEDDEEINEVMSKSKNMGVEFIEALRCIEEVLKAADHGNYSRKSHYRYR